MCMTAVRELSNSRSSLEFRAIPFIPHITEYLHLYPE